MVNNDRSRGAPNASPGYLKARFRYKTTTIVRKENRNANLGAGGQGGRELR